MSFRLMIRCTMSQLSRNDVVAVRWTISSLVTVTSTSSLSASQFLITMSQITSGTSTRRMLLPDGDWARMVRKILASS
jgi:hypothetical protein